MKEQLLFDSISYTKMEPLTSKELVLMKNKIIKQLKIYVPGYLVLTAVGIWFLIRGPEVLNDFHSMRSRVLQPLDLNEDTRARFWLVAPYFTDFLFLLSTIFLVIFYFRSVRPLVLDIKNREKMAVFYKPKKTAMTLFNRYYITIPLYSNQQIEINKTDFDNINEGDLLCLEMGPCSHFLLNLKNNEKNIRIDDLTL